MKKLVTHYDNLQVSYSASASVIRAAFKALSQKWHPDLNQGNRHEKACQNFHLIKLAFDVLSNPESRLKHDLWIKNIRQTKSIPAKKTEKIFNYYSNKEKRKHIDIVV